MTGLEKRFEEVKNNLDDNILLYWEEDTGGSILHRDSNRSATKGAKFYTDAGTISLLKLIDQDVTYDQLIDVLASQPEMNKSEAKEKLKEKFGLLEFNPDRVRGAEDAHPAHADTPHLAVLEINKNCNLTCDFCFANAGPGRQDAVSVEELSHILDELEAIGIAMVWISGGEPLAHPEIDAVLKELSRRKLYVAMATNGTLLAEERYSELVANYVDEIQVSMDGATPETHNSMRGDGTFEQVLRGIRSLKNIDDSTLVSIGMTISERNRSEVAESIKLADQLNVNSWVWGALLPKGRGETLDGQIIGPEGVVDVYETMEAVEDEVDIRILKAMAGLTPMDPAPDEPTARCNAVTWEILIDDDGNVKPCILLREDEFNLGNLFETDLESILATEEAQYFTQSVDEMEEQDDGMPYSLVSAECRSCSFYEEGLCNTFCKAIPHEHFCTKHVEGSPLRESLITEQRQD